MATSTPPDPSDPPARGARLAAIRSINDDAIVASRVEDRARRVRRRWWWLAGSAAMLPFLGALAIVLRELPIRRIVAPPVAAPSRPLPPVPARATARAAAPPGNGRYADPSAVIADLSHADPTVRRQAATRLGAECSRGGADPTTAGNALLKALKDPDEGVRMAAAGALATAFGQFSIVSYQNPRARPVAARALLEALADDAPGVREAVLVALAGVLPDPDDTGPVVPLLKDKDPAVRMAAAVLLVRLGEGEAAADALADAYDDERHEFPSRPELEHLKTMGQRRFSFGGHEPKEILDALVDGLTEPDRPTRRAAALGLADVAKMDADSDHVADALAATLRTSPDPVRRRRALHVLRTLQADTPAVRDALRAAAKEDPNPQVRAEAAGDLGTLEKGKP